LDGALPPVAERWYRRHAGLVRVTHWINVVCFTHLLMSGLQIFNAHPALYVGERSKSGERSPARCFLVMPWTRKLKAPICGRDGALHAAENTRRPRLSVKVNVRPLFF
jgi:hypothetical protein